MERIRKSRITTIISKMLHIYLNKHVSRSAAELAYFLTLSVFPMLICLNALLGKFFPDAEVVWELFESIIPEDAVSVIVDYLSYVAKSNNSAMFTAGLILMATTSAAAFRSLHNAMGDIQGNARYQGVFALIVSFLFSIVFLVAIYFAAAVVISGNWLLQFIDENISFISVSGAWSWLRFVILFLILYCIIRGIYYTTAPRRKGNSGNPGAIAASVVLVVVSMIFSGFISVSVRYPLVYGSLASIIIMMVWLYICGNIVILGYALNVVLSDLHVYRPVQGKTVFTFQPEKKDSKE